MNSPRKLRVSHTGCSLYIELDEFKSRTEKHSKRASQQSYSSRHGAKIQIHRCLRVHLCLCLRRSDSDFGCVHQCPKQFFPAQRNCSTFISRGKIDLK